MAVLVQYSTVWQYGSTVQYEYRYRATVWTYAYGMDVMDSYISYDLIIIEARVEAISLYRYIYITV